MTDFNRIVDEIIDLKEMIANETDPKEVELLKGDLKVLQLELYDPFLTELSWCKSESEIEKVGRVYEEAIY